MSRVLRIYPGLAVLVLLSALALGPLVTSLSPIDYFSSHEVYAYIARDAIALNPLQAPDHLPGVFSQMHSHWGDTVNGSLWTLPWELWMYISLLCAYKLGIFSGPFGVLLTAILVLYATFAPTGLDNQPEATVAIRFLAFFYTGVALRHYAESVPLSWRVLAAATGLFGLTWWLYGVPVLLPPWLGYAVLFAAYHPRLVIARWSDGPDYSYGLYIYAYPVQQTLIWATGLRSPALLMLATLALTLPLAALSWHLVEAPALRLKHRLRDSRRFSDGLATVRTTMRRAALAVR